MSTKPVIDLTSESNIVSQVQVQIPKEGTDICYSIDFIKNPLNDNDDLCHRYLLVMKDIESKTDAPITKQDQLYGQRQSTNSSVTSTLLPDFLLKVN